MSGYIRRKDSLYDPITGALVGYIDANGNEQVGYPVSAHGNSVQGGTVARPGLLLIGNSITGQSVRAGVQYTSAITAAEVRAGSNQITLVAGGVAALGLSVNDFIVVGLCSQQPWPVQVTAISTETLTLARRLPLMLRTSAGVSKVTAPVLWGGTPRGQVGIHNAANQLLGSPFDVLPGHGHGSATSDQIIAALPALLDRYRPAAAMLSLFENDVAATSLTAARMAQIADNAAGMCLASGCRPIVLHSLPSFSINSSRAAAYDDLRAAILSIGDRVPGAIGADPGAIYLDTSNGSTPRAALPGWTDGVVHPTEQYRYTIGAQLTGALALCTAGQTVNWDALLFGTNPTLAGTGGTASGAGLSGAVPASTTVTAEAGVTVVASKTAGDRLRLVGSIAGASNISTTRVLVAQTFTLPTTWGPRGRYKLIVGVTINSATKLNSLTLGAAFGSQAVDVRTSPSALEMDAALVGRRIVLESAAFPILDPAVTSTTITLSIRPMNVGSPSGVAFDVTIDCIGIALTPWGELDDGAVALM